MNKIYKLKFNRLRQQLVAVSEIASGAGKNKTQGQIDGENLLSQNLCGKLKPLSLASFLLFGMLPGISLAANLPTGASVVSGSASIATTDKTMTINQGTPKLVADWHSFDIARDHTVNFVQPTSSAIALNRVTGVSPSQIMGTLTANGRVILVNPNGMLFGKDASVNTAGLIAATQNIRTEDFMQGTYRFSGTGVTSGQIINQGSLTTSKDGFIVLAAQQVINKGKINATSGNVHLAAADSVTLRLDNAGLTGVTVNGDVLNALVENQGLVSATNGQVYLTARGKDMLLKTVVNNTGTVEAKGISASGGLIRLDGGHSGVVTQAGNLLADSLNAKGGKVVIEGQNIHLADGSKTSATGGSAGGEVYTGGGWLGKNPDIRNANKLVMSKNAFIDVSAINHGNGGTAVLWSEEYTHFLGKIHAKGGSNGGNGGKVETSSRNHILAFGDVTANALKGKGGEWLIDPVNIQIVTGTETEANVDKTTVESAYVFAPASTASTGSKIRAADIASKLTEGTSVTIQTSGGASTAAETGNITFADNITIAKTGGGDATLTLIADNNIVVGNSTGTTAHKTFSSTAGKLNLTLLAGKTTDNSSVILGTFFGASLNGGDFYVGSAKADGGSISLSDRNQGKINAANITLNVTGGFAGTYTTLNATSNLTVLGGVNYTGAYNLRNIGFFAGDTLTISATKGNISFVAQDAGETGAGKVKGADITLSGTKAVSINTNNGTMNFAVANTSNSNLTISSTEGDISITAISPDISVTADALAMTYVKLNAAASINLTGHTSGATFGKGVALHNVTINAATSTTLAGGSVASDAIHLHDLNLTSGQDINISGISTATGDVNKDKHGIELVNSTITSTSGNVTLNGTSSAKSTGLDGIGTEIEKATITANKTISITGITNGGAKGLRVSNSSLNATSAMFTGSTQSATGTGFDLVNITLLGTLKGEEGLANISLSSKGSAKGSKNSMDISLIKQQPAADVAETTPAQVDASLVNVLLKKRPDNDVILNMSNVVIFDDTASETKGWDLGLTTEALTGGNWEIMNSSVKAAGDVNLQGIGFVNTNVSLSKGNLTLGYGSDTSIYNSIINVTDGSVNIAAQNSSVRLSTGTRITAKSDINITASGGMVEVENAVAGSLINITSSDGNISLSGDLTTVAEADKSADTHDALQLVNTSIIANKGSIYLEGKSADQNQGAVHLTNVTLNAALANVTINATGQTIGNPVNGNATLTFVGNNSISGKTINISAKNTLGSEAAKVSHFPLAMDVSNATLNLSGNGKLTATSEGVGILVSKNANLNITKGKFTIQTIITTPDKPESVTATVLATSGAAPVTASSSPAVPSSPASTSPGGVTAAIPGAGGVGGAVPGAGTVPSGGAGTVPGAGAGSAPGAVAGAAVPGGAVVVPPTVPVPPKTPRTTAGLLFSGGTEGVKLNIDTGTGVRVSLLSDVSAIKTADKAAPVSAFSEIKPSGSGKSNNLVLKGTGDIFVTGKTYSTPGIDLTLLNVAGLTGNLAVTGDSVIGTGVTLTSATIPANISVRGISSQGVGLSIEGGSTIDLKGKTLAGITSTGSAGVQVKTSANINITNGTLKGSALAGTGGGIVFVGETRDYGLINAMVSGTATGGAGVSAPANLTVTNTTLKGASNEKGDGIVVTGHLNTSLKAIINGIAKEGTGLKVGSDLNMTNTSLSAVSAIGDGVNVTGNATLTDNITLQGTSGSKGTAILISGNATLTNVTQMKGAAGEGKGINFAGNVTAEKTTLAAASNDGEAIHFNQNVTLNNSTLRASTVSGDAVKANVTTVLTNTTITGNTGTGNALVFAGLLDIKDDKSTITGTASGDQGNGVSLLNNVTGVTGSTIIGKAVSGEGISLTAGDTATNVINNVTLQGSSTSSTGINLNGNITLTKAILTGTTETGTAVMSGLLLNMTENTSTISGTATKDKGHGVVLKKQVTGLANVITGKAMSGHAIKLEDEASLNNVSLSGNASSGIAISLNGNTSLTKTALQGTTESGKGIMQTNKDSKLSLMDKESTLTGTASKNGTGVSLMGAMVMAADVVGVINGTSASGTGLELADIDVNNATLTGTSASGMGTYLKGKVRVKRSNLTATTETGTGLRLAGSLESDNETSTITAKATREDARGIGANLSGNLKDVKLAATATSGEGLQLSAKLSNSALSGTSDKGIGVHVLGATSLLEKSTLTAKSTSGKTDLRTTGKLSTDKESTFDAKTIDRYDLIIDKIIIAQNSSQKLNGVLAAMKETVNAKSEVGYQPVNEQHVPNKDFRDTQQTISLQLCTDSENCHSMNMDNIKPGQPDA